MKRRAAAALCEISQNVRARPGLNRRFWANFCSKTHDLTAYLRGLKGVVFAPSPPLSPVSRQTVVRVTECASLSAGLTLYPLNPARSRPDRAVSPVQRQPVRWSSPSAVCVTRRPEDKTRHHSPQARSSASRARSAGSVETARTPFVGRVC